MKTIGKYEIRGLLGTGGMGRVYKVRDPETGRMAALKHLSPAYHMKQLLGEAAIRDLFIYEAKTIAGIRHPHIPQILDMDADRNGQPFFVMAYHCMNLGLLIGEHYEIERPTRILPPRRAMHYMDQILLGMAALHSAGIIHRDIKPYNILIGSDDTVQIIDFGLSRLRNEVRSFPENFKIGTPYYAAPEQEAAPDSVDVRSDLYSAGVLAWRLFTGRLPEENDAVQSAGDINPVLKQIWDPVLQKGVCKDPGKRFQTSGEMRDELWQAYQKWVEALEQTCALELPPSRPPSCGRENIPLRTDAIKVRSGEAPERFRTDQLMRPILPAKSRWVSDEGPIVRDLHHGLIWQQSGSDEPLGWPEANAYVDMLNDKHHAGIGKWRIPTIDELSTLIRPADALGDFCQPELFDNRKTRFWSIDAKSYTSCWFVDTESGFIAHQDKDCRFFARAVASARDLI